MCNLGSCQENYIPAVKLKYRFDWSVRPGTRADVEWIAGVLDRGSTVVRQINRDNCLRGGEEAAISFNSTLSQPLYTLNEYIQGLPTL